MAQLISPIVDYMLRNNMIWDVTSEISPKMEQKQFTFTATGGLGLQIWKPYYFEADETLDGSAIKGISVMTRAENDPLVGGSQTLASADSFGKLLLWLVDDKGDILSVLPLSVLIASSSTTISSAFVKYQKFEMKDVILQKCYITISDTTGINVGESILFNIFYEDKYEMVD